MNGGFFMSLDTKVNSILNEIGDFDIKRNKIKTFLKALIECEGFISEAAEICGIGRDTAYRMIRQNKAIKKLIEEIREDRRQSRRSKKYTKRFKLDDDDEEDDDFDTLYED